MADDECLVNPNGFGCKILEAGGPRGGGYSYPLKPKQCPVGKSTSAKSPVNAERLRAQLTGQEISKGHAFNKHVLKKGEFQGLGIRTRKQFAEHIEKVIMKPTATKNLDRGRTAYWDKKTGTVVIRNPKDPDGGTAFRPDEGIKYFDGL